VGGGRTFKIPFKSAMLLFFMRVKRGYDFDHLAYLNGVKGAAAPKSFHFILYGLDRIFKHEFFNLMSQTNLENAPGMECMKDYPQRSAHFGRDRVFHPDTAQICPSEAHLEHI
jgi:hypothetical protein